MYINGSVLWARGVEMEVVVVEGVHAPVGRARGVVMVVMIPGGGGMSMG